MRTTVYIVVIVVCFSITKYWATFAGMLGLAHQVTPAATPLDRYRDEAKKSITEYRMGEVEGRMATLYKTATDPSKPIDEREAALVELEKEKKNAEDISGVTDAKKSLQNLTKGFETSISPEAQARLQSLQEVGWSGGDANNGTSNVSWFSVTSVEVADSALNIRYSWKEGVLRGSLKGTTYRGEWIQANGSGRFELNFSSDFSRADGWWASADNPGQRLFFAIK